MPNRLPVGHPFRKPPRDPNPHPIKRAPFGHPVEATTSTTIPQDCWRALKQESEQKQLSMTYILGMILRSHYNLPRPDPQGMIPKRPQFLIQRWNMLQGELTLARRYIDTVQQEMESLEHRYRNPAPPDETTLALLASHSIGTEPTK